MCEEKKQKQKDNMTQPFFSASCVISLCPSSVMATIHRLHDLCWISTGTKQNKWWKCRKFSLNVTVKLQIHDITLSTNTISVVSCSCRSHQSNQNKHIRILLISVRVKCSSSSCTTVCFFCGSMNSLSEGMKHLIRRDKIGEKRRSQFNQEAHLSKHVFANAPHASCSVYTLMCFDSK